MPSELMVIQQNMSFIDEGYAKLGETLRSRAAQLSSLVQEVKEAQKETDDMMKWLKDMKNTTESWSAAAAEKESVKTQLEQQKVQKVSLHTRWSVEFSFATERHVVLTFRIHDLFCSFKAFEGNMKQKQEALQNLRQKLLSLIKTHPNSPEAAKWKQLLAEIGMVQGVGSRWPCAL